MISVPGSWKSLEELEDSLTLDELTNIVVAKRKHDHEERKFQAQLHEMELDGGEQEESAFERVQKRAAAKLEAERKEQGGLSDNDEALMAIGIGVTRE